MGNEKKIEIPFGAFDSELIHQEINIPNGFNAVIEGNKIILTRAESEDERIRKAIHIYLDWLDGHKDYQPKGNYTIKDMIAWLEKQDGESVNIDIESMVSSYEQRVLSQSNGVRNNPLINMCLSAFRQGIENTLEELNLKKLEKQGEQKTAEKIEPFDKYEGLTDFERTLADICIGWIGEEFGWKQYIKDNADVLLKIAVEKFNSVQDVPFEQNPATSYCQEHCKGYQETGKCFADGDCKDKRKAEQKSAWSEEDEYKLNMCITAIETYYKWDSMVDWLKSLKQRIGG